MIRSGFTAFRWCVRCGRKFKPLGKGQKVCGLCNKSNKYNSLKKTKK